MGYNRMKSCRKCGNKFPSKSKIDGVVRNHGSRRYCLTCSPFGAHNTKNFERPQSLGVRACSACKEILSDDQFYVRGRGGPSAECKTCTIKRVSAKHRESKQILVNALGGKCSVCDYNKSLNALTFHHKDPATKSFGIANYLSAPLSELLAEASKCILLCSNCHAEEHDICMSP